MSSQTNPLPPREDSVGSSGLILKAPSPKEFLNISAISASVPHVEHEETSSTSVASPPLPSNILFLLSLRNIAKSAQTTSFQLHLMEFFADFLVLKPAGL